MRRFFVDGEYEIGGCVELKAADSKHFAKVLRGNVGDEIQIVAGEQVFLAEVTEVRETVKAELREQTAEYAEAPIDLYLLQGIAKGERMDLIIQKAVELGARAIVPVAFERCVVQLKGAKAADKKKRWQKIAESAAKQCGRQRITEIMPVSSLSGALDLLPSGAKIIMPWEEAEGSTLKEVLTAGEPSANIAVIIGPEGGLTKSEVEAARARGAEVVTLGKRILRTETAAIAVVTIIMYQWADLG
ncbi:MAG: 16S rRNA (uracil(1498)-N(3))-methyltransferase [Bacillota bacterium]|jgi:16S rRNA (uracil1498-N3)-methyltransferase